MAQRRRTVVSAAAARDDGGERKDRADLQSPDLFQHVGAGFSLSAQGESKERAEHQFKSAFGRKWYRVFQAEVRSPLQKVESQKKSFNKQLFAKTKKLDRKNFAFYNKAQGIKKELEKDPLALRHDIVEERSEETDRLLVTGKTISISEGEMIPKAGAPIDHIQPLMPGDADKGGYNKNSIIARLEAFSDDWEAALESEDEQTRKEAEQFRVVLEERHYLTKNGKINEYMAKQYANDLDNLIWMSTRGNTEKSNQPILKLLRENILFSDEFIQHYGITIDGGILYKGFKKGERCGLRPLMSEWLDTEHTEHLRSTLSSEMLKAVLDSLRNRVLEAPKEIRKSAAVMLRANLTVQQAAQEVMRPLVDSALAGDIDKSAFLPDSPRPLQMSAGARAVPRVALSPRLAVAFLRKLEADPDGTLELFARNVQQALVSAVEDTVADSLPASPVHRAASSQDFTFSPLVPSALGVQVQSRQIPLLDQGTLSRLQAAPGSIPDPDPEAPVMLDLSRRQPRRAQNMEVGSPSGSPKHDSDASSRTRLSGSPVTLPSRVPGGSEPIVTGRSTGTDRQILQGLPGAVPGQFQSPGSRAMLNLSLRQPRRAQNMEVGSPLGSPKHGSDASSRTRLSGSPVTLPSRVPGGSEPIVTGRSPGAGRQGLLSAQGSVPGRFQSPGPYVEQSPKQKGKSAGHKRRDASLGESQPTRVFVPPDPVQLIDADSPRVQTPQKSRRSMASGEDKERLDFFRKLLSLQKQGLSDRPSKNGVKRKISRSPSPPESAATDAGQREVHGQHSLGDVSAAPQRQHGMAELSKLVTNRGLYMPSVTGQVIATAQASRQSLQDGAGAAPSAPDPQKQNRKAGSRGSAKRPKYNANG